MNTMEVLHDIALKAPKGSGVYLWKDVNEKIIYVGKAKNLKNRLSSYFAKQKDVKTRILISRATSLEYIETKTEYEALLLENTLIKQHHPKYNISLKDGKTYPVIKLTNEKFPRIFRTRVLKNDGALYFGPFPNVYAVDNFLQLIKQNYKLRECKTLRQRKSPCLYYHIGLCGGPCCGKVDANEYAKEVAEVKNLLTNTESVEKLNLQMQEAAKKLDFEKAKKLRDGLQSILALHNQNVVEDLNENSRDYIAWATEGAVISFAVLKMRNGKLVARDLYRTQSLKDDDEILTEFLPIYYKNKNEVPPIIFVLSFDNQSNFKESAVKTSKNILKNWFENELNVKTKITSLPILLKQNYETETDGASYVAEKTFFASELEKTVSVSINDDIIAERLGMTVKDFRHHRAAMSMAYFNAHEDVIRRLKEYGDWSGMEELKKVLSLENLPLRIEGFDISHLDGKFTVASMVSFKDGVPDKKNYRIFKLRTTANINNDYASMQEVVARRYTRLLNEDLELPDLILIDGGLGQVNIASQVLSAINLNIPVIGLAEKNEEIYFPHNNKPLRLSRHSDALKLLQRVRDESHRFANTRNNKMRKKASLTLEFEQLPHIGSARAKLLLQKYGTIEKLAEVSKSELAKILKLSEKATNEILQVCKTLV